MESRVTIYLWGMEEIVMMTDTMGNKKPAVAGILKFNGACLCGLSSQSVYLEQCIKMLID